MAVWGGLYGVLGGGYNRRTWGISLANGNRCSGYLPDTTRRALSLYALITPGIIKGVDALSREKRETTQSLTQQPLAPLAQLDRASVYGTEGYRFESCGVCFHKSNIGKGLCSLQCGEGLG